MTTPLLLLRAVQLGVHISEMDLLTIGTINDKHRKHTAVFRCKAISIIFNARG